MVASKKDWNELEKLKKENERAEKQVKEIKDRIKNNLKKNSHYYDGLRDDEH